MKTICSNEQCDSQAYCRGFCRKHYVRMMRRGELKVIMPKGVYNGCSVDGCEGKHSCKSYCSKHYDQFWRVGHILTDEEKTANYRAAHPKGYWPGKWGTQFVKGQPSLRKGIKTGKPAWNRIGEGVTQANKLERSRFRKTVQKEVFSRDNYTCQICDQYGGHLQVDHIKSWADYPELRFEADNCRTLCMACHYYITFKRKLPDGVIWGHNLSRGIAS